MYAHTTLTFTHCETHAPLARVRWHSSVLLHAGVHVGRVGGAGLHVAQHSPCTYDGNSPDAHDRCRPTHCVTCVDVHTVSGRRHDGQHMPLDLTAMSVAAQALREFEHFLSCSDSQRVAPLLGRVPASLFAANLHVVQQLVRLKAGTSLVEQTRKLPVNGFTSAEHAAEAD
jgi:hypothetical protein